jgi:hypothetical protein
MILLTEKKLIHLINESIYEAIGNRKNLIVEGAESRNMSAAKHYIYDKLNCGEEKALQIIGAIKTDIPNSRLCKCKFMLGIVRMYLDNELSNGVSILNLNRALKLVASEAHVNEYNQDLNGLSCQDLIDKFKNATQQDLQNQKDELGKDTFTVNNDYTIVKIDTFEEASKYSEYTSWCVTHYEDMYDNYTNEGLGRFYFCLKNGFENTPKEREDNSPLDEYGLSMIAVSVNMDGSCNTITCRWNHDNGGNDSIMTDKELSQLIGKNFYDTFLPKTREELEKTGIFKDGWCSIETKGGYNFINIDGEYLSNEDFDKVGNFNEGFAVVKLHGEFNFINPNGDFISNQWFDSAYDFNKGFALVRLNWRYNYISTEGQFLSKTWFDNVYDFGKGFIRVKIDEKWNFINPDWQLVSNKWFDGAHDFKEGFARVEIDKKYNYINAKGQFISNTWFNYAYDFNEGFANVELNGKWNFITLKAQFLSETWFDKVNIFKEGFATVKLNGFWNYIDKNGKFLSKRWFYSLTDFQNGIATVFLDDSRVFDIDTQGNIVNH